MSDSSGNSRSLMSSSCGVIDETAMAVPRTRRLKQLFSLVPDLPAAHQYRFDILKIHHRGRVTFGVARLRMTFKKEPVNTTRGDRSPRQQRRIVRISAGLISQ